MAVVYIFANFFVQMYNLQSAGKLVIKMYQLWNWGVIRQIYYCGVDNDKRRE